MISAAIVAALLAACSGKPTASATVASEAPTATPASTQASTATATPTEPQPEPSKSMPTESPTSAAPTKLATTVSYTDADGYMYTTDVSFPAVEASSDISGSKPGETQITASIPIDYTIYDSTVGRDAPMPAMHLDYLWPATSAVCKSQGQSARAATLGGVAYCTLGIYTKAPGAPKIVAGGKYAQGRYDSRSDATQMGARYKYSWTVSEATQAAVLEGLRGPTAVVVSGAKPQGNTGKCAFSGTDGTTGSTEYAPLWSSIEIGCGTPVG